MTRNELLQVAGPMPPFVPELRKAIREGSKTHTRRVVVPTQTKPFVPPLTMEPLLIDGVQDTDDRGFPCWSGTHPDYHTGEKWFSCPYGKAGEIRYLREPLMRDERGFARYADDGALVLDAVGDVVVWHWKVVKLAQIYMPKKFARTFVKLDAIRVERLHEMKAPDAIAEGIERDSEYYSLDRALEVRLIGGSWLVDRFANLWDVINAKRGYPWIGNWWVWVLVFKLVSDRQDGDQ